MKAEAPESRLIAGIQAGMAGALSMLAWMALATVWTKHSIWWYPNLLATTFGGDPALTTGFGRFTLAGIALHLMQYALFGGVLGWLLGGQSNGARVGLLSCVLALVYYFVAYHFVWRAVNPLIPLYSPDRQLIVGHILFGMMMGRIPRYAASVPATG